MKWSSARGPRIIPAGYGASAPPRPTHLQVTLATPTSPDDVNLIPSLVADTATESPMVERSFAMRVKSAQGMRIWG
jgi:hypothetical protein